MLGNLNPYHKVFSGSADINQLNFYFYFYFNTFYCLFLPVELRNSKQVSNAAMSSASSVWATIKRYSAWETLTMPRVANFIQIILGDKRGLFLRNSLKCLDWVKQEEILERAYFEGALRAFLLLCIWS
jgi:hypothetical protein